MSKYWSKMNILRKKLHNNLFISQNKPILIFKKNYELDTSSKRKFTEQDFHDLSAFYNKNYNIDNGINITQLSSASLKRYAYVDSEILFIKNDEMIGSIISILIPTKIITNLNKNTLEISNRLQSHNFEDSLVLACTSFLVLDKKYRKKGYGMSLIQESLQILHNNGGLGAYFINSVSRCINSVKLNIWYFPLNIDKLKKYNYPYPSNYKFNIPDVKNLIIEKVNDEYEVFNFYHSLIKNKKFAFSPSFSQWKKWTHVFPTYTVSKEGNKIGIFSFDFNELRCPLNRMIFSRASLLICIGDQPNTLNSALSICKNIYDILEFYQTGDLTSSLLSSIFSQKYDRNKWINFYNMQIDLNSSEIYVPIF